MKCYLKLNFVNEHIKVFACLFYVHKIQILEDKFKARTRRYIFVGYPYERNDEK